MKTNRIGLVLLLSTLLTAATGCALISQFLRGELQRPEAEVVGARISRITFDEITLLFDVEVRNPNDIEVALAGFDYDLTLQESPFLSGESERGITLAAGGTAVIEVPVTLAYNSVLSTVESISAEREARYRLDLGLHFDLPGLGAVRVGAGREGTIPIVELPTLRVASLRMQAFSFTGATLLLSVELDNPNDFGGSIEELAFNFEVDGDRWAGGELSGGYEVGPMAASQIEIPIYVDFIALGNSARNLLRGDHSLSYLLDGRATILPDWELLGAREFSFELRGETTL